MEKVLISFIILIFSVNSNAMNTEERRDSVSIFVVSFLKGHLSNTTRKTIKNRVGGVNTELYADGNIGGTRIYRRNDHSVTDDYYDFIEVIKSKLGGEYTISQNNTPSHSERAGDQDYSCDHKIFGTGKTTIDYKDNRITINYSLGTESSCSGGKTSHSSGVIGFYGLKI